MEFRDNLLLFNCSMDEVRVFGHLAWSSQDNLLLFNCSMDEVRVFGHLEWSSQDI